MLKTKTVIFILCLMGCSAEQPDRLQTEKESQVGAPIGNKIGFIYRAGEVRDNLASVRSFGSATRVGPNHVLTAAHLFPDIAEQESQTDLFVAFAPETELYEQPGQLPSLIVHNHDQSLPIQYLVRKPDYLEAEDSQNDVAIGIFAPSSGPIPEWDALGLQSDPVPLDEPGSMNCAFRQLGFGRYQALYEVPTCISSGSPAQALAPGSLIISYGAWEGFGDIVACGGDSGGPVLNFQSKIVGVTSALLAPPDVSDCRQLLPSQVAGVAADVTGGSNREFVRRVLATCDAYMSRSECVEVYPTNTCGNLAALSGFAQSQISCFQVKEPTASGCDATWPTAVCQAYQTLNGGSGEAWPAEMAQWSVIAGTDNGKTNVQTASYTEACAMCLAYTAP